MYVIRREDPVQLPRRKTLTPESSCESDESEGELVCVCVFVAVYMTNCGDDFCAKCSCGLIVFRGIMVEHRTCSGSGKS